MPNQNTNKPYLTIIFTVIITIIVVFFVLFFIILLYIDDFKAKFLTNFNIQLKEYCDSLPQPIFESNISIPSPNTYNLNTANSLMNLNFISSTYNCVNQEIILPPNFTNYETFKDKNNTIYGIAYWNTSKVVICFCGSLLLDQWATDLEYPQVKPTKINGTSDTDLIHEGFYNSYINICQDKILALLTNLPTNDVVITGHSLGGALSTLCAFDIFTRDNTYNSTTHYSFASPRVGNSSFAQNYNTKINGSRVNNTEDLIPQFPIAKMGKWEYEHVGQNIPFTISLGSVKENHINAYNQLPSCPLPVGICN